MTNRFRTALLLVILALGLTLRLWYGSWGPNVRRFWDERYALDNVRSILVEGTLRPARSYYPSPVFNLPPAALLATSEALYRSSGNERFRTMDGGRFTPTSFLLCRWLQAVYGVLGILLTFLVARRLTSETAALIAAAAVGFAPWHIHASGYFKPDALLVSSVVLAFLLALRAVARPGLGRYATAGAGVALAMSAKLTGGLVAVPLVLGTFWSPNPRSTLADRRRWTQLIVAGAASLAVFFALNPYGRWYLRFLSGLKDDYAMRAGLSQMSRTDVPLEVVRLILDRSFHGPVLGTVSLLGLAVASYLFLFTRRGAQGDDRADDAASAAPWAMLVGFALAWVLALAAQTAYFKPNNFLPLLPFTSIALGWFLSEVWRRAKQRAPRLGSVAPSVVSSVILIALLALPGVIYVYRSVLPSTLDVAYLSLRTFFKPPHGRLVYAETRAVDPRWEGAQPLSDGLAAAIEVPDLQQVPEERLRSADALIFPSAALVGRDAGFYHGLVAARETHNVRPRPLRTRGRPLVAAVDRWRRLGVWHLTDGQLTSGADPGAGRWRADPPPRAAVGTWLSVGVSFPPRLVDEGVGELWIGHGGERLALAWTSRGATGRQRLTSPRFRFAGGPVDLQLPVSVPTAPAQGLEVSFYLWRRPRASRSGTGESGSGAPPLSPSPGAGNGDPQADPGSAPPPS